MSWVDAPGREHSQTYEPHPGDTVASITAKDVYRWGHDGDHNPGALAPADRGSAFVDPTIANRGAEDVEVGASLIKMVIGDEFGVQRSQTVEGNASRTLSGVFGELTVFVPGASAGGPLDLETKMTRQQNDGSPNRAPQLQVAKGGGAHPGHDPPVSARVIGLSGGTVKVVCTVPAKFASLYEIADIKLWARAAPTTAGVYTLAIDGNGNNMLSTATFDLTTLVALTVTTLTKTATTADLDLDGGQLVTFTITSDTADLANGDFFIGVIWQARP